MGEPTLPLRARRLQGARNDLEHVVAQRDATIERLVKLEAKAKRLRKQVARLERPAPVKAPAPPAPVTVPAAAAPAPDAAAGRAIPLAELGETEIGKANAESWNAVTKPKRRRKAPPGSETAALLHTPPAARKTKMEALGFRKI
jgi:hypothetical protein